MSKIDGVTFERGASGVERYFGNFKTQKNHHLDEDVYHVSRKELESVKCKISPAADKFIEAILSDNNYELLSLIELEFSEKNDAEVSVQDLVTVVYASNINLAGRRLEALNNLKKAVIEEGTAPAPSASPEKKEEEGITKKEVSQMITSVKPVKQDPVGIISLYDRCLKSFSRRPASKPDELYIADPSQPISPTLPKIVSEGQSWYQLISARMAQINPAKASEYQKDFDAILAGTEHMIALAKASGNRGEFSAWKVTIENGVVKLAPTNDGPGNSAADADLDLIKSLIYAQDNVDKKLWVDKKYGERALSLIRHATTALFRNENGVLVLKPSEDWADFNFTDYMAPATCMEIAEFCEKKGEKDLAATWKQAASDSMKLYEAALRDIGEFPAQIDFIVSGSKAIRARAHNNYHQTYDGIRSPWHIGEYAGGFSAQPDEMGLAARAFEIGKSKGFRYTASAAMDEAMYLPLARAIGRKDDVQKMTSDIFEQIPADNKYFENTLVLIGLMTTYYPARNFSNPVPTVAIPQPAVQPEKTQPEAPAPKPASVSGAAGEKKFELGANVWNVNPGRIKSGQVSSSGNSVVLNNATTSDATGFKFNTAEVGNFQYLVVNIKDGAKGNFNWGDKVFKIEFNERPVNPENVSASDSYLDTDAKGKIYYKIPSGLRDIQIVFGQMTQASAILEFYLSNEIEK